MGNTIILPGDGKIVDTKEHTTSLAHRPIMLIGDGIDNGTLVAQFDQRSGQLVIIRSSHHHTHEGESFTTTAVDETMGDSDTIVLAFKTPAGTRRAHMVVEFETLVGCHVEILEGPTWTTSTGSQVALVNRLRGGATSTLLEDTSGSFTATGNVSRDPSGLSGGTAIWTSYAFGSQVRIPSSARDLSEMVLQADTAYAVRLTADGAANKGQLTLHHYEHPDSA